MPAPASHRLRIGRRSLRDHVYLCTFETANRARLFEDLWLARIVVREMMESDARGRTTTLAFVVMPDHVHWLMQLAGEMSISAVVKQVKAFSARAINARRGRRAAVWQTGFHDHGVRRHESLQRIANYVIDNPLRAELVETLGAYPHWYTAWQTD